jgi:hypothetical protein
MILRLKDAEGNIHDVLAIKGKDGKDYVLTEADKQEIAGMVSGGGGSGGSYVLTDEDKQEIADMVEVSDYVLTEADKQEIADMVEVSDYVLTEADKQEIADMVDNEGFIKKHEDCIVDGLWVQKAKWTFEDMKKRTTVVSPEGADSDSVITKGDWFPYADTMDLSGADQNCYEIDATYEFADVGNVSFLVVCEESTGLRVQVDGVDVDVQLTSSNHYRADFAGEVKEKIFIQVLGGVAHVSVYPDVVARIDRAGGAMFNRDIVLKKDGQEYSIASLIEKVNNLVSGDEVSY